jgi:hypothetical protein
VKLLAFAIAAVLLAGVFSATRGLGEDPTVAVRVTPEADERVQTSPPRPHPTPTTASRSRRSLPTGRHLPAVLLRIRHCESHDNYRARNQHSSASGAWQILDGTWDRFRGYRRAVHAPRAVQDAKALALFADRGTQPWNASRRCWS